MPIILAENPARGSLAQLRILLIFKRFLACRLCVAGNFVCDAKEKPEPAMFGRSNFLFHHTFSIKIALASQGFIHQPWPPTQAISRNSVLKIICKIK
jgi:hypothetical protein